jgi:lipopolysaccharide transport system ATP-binding protein
VSDDIIISVENLGKRYSLRHLRDQRYVALRDVIANSVRSSFKRLRNGRRSKIEDGRSGNGSGLVALDANLPSSNSQLPSKEDFWALRNISFEVRRGEVVGIIGRNGAGKSTLLKILSRITEPTEGKVTLRGRVASLLEVGTGFHPELTGRENIYLNGAILGMSRAEIRAKFDEIVAFAETEKFLDTPVKRYSSGMYVRLAFAVAAHLEPEILVVDEVLAVGDAEFQKKCLGKMREVAEGHGRTVLFVSHNMVAVQNLCSVAMWLSEGKLLGKGAATEIIRRYLQTDIRNATQRTWNDYASAPGTESFKLLRASIQGKDGDDTLTISTPLIMEFEYLNLNEGARLNLSVDVINEHGLTVFNTVPYTDAEWHGKPFPCGVFRSAIAIPAFLLNDGSYRVRVMVVYDQAHIHYVIDDVLALEVTDDQPREGWQGKWQGVVRPRLQWRTEFLGSSRKMPDRVADTLQA